MFQSLSSRSPIRLLSFWHFHLFFHFFFYLRLLLSRCYNQRFLLLFFLWLKLFFIYLNNYMEDLAMKFFAVQYTYSLISTLLIFVLNKSETFACAVRISHQSARFDLTKVDESTIEHLRSHHIVQVVDINICLRVSVL